MATVTEPAMDYAKGNPSWLEEAHPREDDGTFALKITKVGGKKGEKFENLGGAQQTLFQTGGEKDQMNLFADKGVPDELLPKHLRGQQEKPPEKPAEIKPGDKLEFPNFNKEGKHNFPTVHGPYEVWGIKDGKAYVGRAEGDFKKDPNYWKAPLAAVMPQESLSHFVNDLSGKFVGPQSDIPEIEAVRQGKAEVLGKGDDGIAFGVGDKVVKMSTTVPYVPENPGHRTPQEAMEMIAEDYANNKMMRNDGIPGIPELQLKKHGDKAFLIGDRYEIPDKLTPDQLEQVRQSLEAMHAKGWAMRDDIQVGVDKNGKVWHFDTGKAEKTNDKWDQDNDMQSLRALYNRHGVEFPSAAKEALQHWYDAHELYADADPNDLKEIQSHLHQDALEANNARRSRLLQVSKPERDELNAKFHGQITKLGLNPADYFLPSELAKFQPQQTAPAFDPHKLSPGDKVTLGGPGGDMPAEHRGYHNHPETGEKMARVIGRPKDSPPFEMSAKLSQLKPYQEEQKPPKKSESAPEPPTAKEPDKPKPVKKSPKPAPGQKTLFRKRYAKDGENGGGWKMLGSAPVFVNSQGVIEKGCEGLRGYELSELESTVEERQQKQDAFEDAGGTSAKQDRAKQTWDAFKGMDPDHEHFIGLVRHGGKFHSFGNDAQKLRQHLGVGDGDKAEIDEDSFPHQMERLVEAGHRVAVIDRDEKTGQPDLDSEADPEAQQAVQEAHEDLAKKQPEAAPQQAPEPSTQAWQIPFGSMMSKEQALKAHHDTYLDDEGGMKVESSRTTPSEWASTGGIKPGTWVKSFNGLHGTNVEQLQILDPFDLELQEDDYYGTNANPEGRGWDSERYADWMRQGKSPPPIEVVETEEGKFRVVDGHRRVGAAKKAGQKIAAWVSPIANLDAKDSRGKPIQTGMTYELAMRDALREGQPIPPEVRQHETERMRGIVGKLQELDAKYPRSSYSDQYKEMGGYLALLEQQPAAPAAEEPAAAQPEAPEVASQPASPTLESVKDQIRHHFQSNPGGIDLRDLRETLGHKQVDPQNPLGNLVHKAVREMVDSGEATATNQQFGTPTIGYKGSPKPPETIPNRPESVPNHPADPSASIPRVSNEDWVSGNWDQAHAGLTSEIVAAKMAAGMKGIEGREYGIREHSPGKWQLISRPEGAGQPSDESHAENWNKLTEQPPTFASDEELQQALDFGQHLQQHHGESLKSGAITPQQHQSLQGMIQGHLERLGAELERRKKANGPEPTAAETPRDTTGESAVRGREGHNAGVLAGGSDNPTGATVDGGESGGPAAEGGLSDEGTTGTADSGPIGSGEQGGAATSPENAGLDAGESAHIPASHATAGEHISKAPGPVKSLLESLHRLRDTRKTGKVETKELNPDYAKSMYDHLKAIQLAGDDFGEVHDLSEDLGHGALGYSSPGGNIAMIPPKFKGEDWSVRYVLPHETQTIGQPGTNGPVKPEEPSSSGDMSSPPSTGSVPAAEQGPSDREPGVGEIPASPKPPRKPRAERVSPKSEMNRAVMEAVGDDPEEQAGFRQVVDDVYKEHERQVDSNNSAVRNLLGQFGFSGNGIGRFVKALRTYDDADQFIRGKKVLAPDGRVLRQNPSPYGSKFDQMVEMAMNYHPELLGSETTGGIGSKSDAEHALFMRLHNGLEAKLKPWDDAIISQALGAKTSQSGHAKRMAEDPEYRARMEAIDRLEFSRNGRKLRWCRQNLQRWYKYAKQMSFSFDEDEHPRAKENVTIGKTDYTPGEWIPKDKAEEASPAEAKKIEVVDKDSGEAQDLDEKKSAGELTSENYKPRLWDAMNNAWDSGKTLIVQTRMRATAIGPDHREFMRLTESGDVQLREGKNWNSVIGETLDHLGQQVGMPPSWQAGGEESKEDEPEATEPPKPVKLPQAVQDAIKAERNPKRRAFAEAYAQYVARGEKGKFPETDLPVMAKQGVWLGIDKAFGESKGVEPEKPAESPSKPAWQMTRAEWHQSEKSKPGYEVSAANREYKQSVADAIAAGEDVPPSSYQDYSDLAAEVARRQAESTPDEGDIPESDEPAKEPESKAPEAPKEPRSLLPEDDTPRDLASHATEEQLSDDEEYAFARKSAISNVGEDVLGSARHKFNAWRSLEEAEKEGTAQELVTRDKLLKNEPHSLMAHVEQNPLTALAMHHALRNFPAKPGYGKRYKPDEELAKKDRAQYLETYRHVKGLAESLAAKESDPVKALTELRTAIQKKIGSLRGQKGEGYMAGVTASDRYNSTANSLVKLSNQLSTHRLTETSVATQVGKLVAAMEAKYGKDIPVQQKRENVIRHASDIMEGQSLNESFGTKESRERYNPLAVYVSSAQREDGKDLPKDPVKQVKFLKDDMGMRAVQWGNTVSDDEREHHLEKASEALMDLSDVVGLPVSNISGEGTLALAIGARGKSRASAHYEPGHKIINLTRRSGVGSLAHEWGHFFDHWIAGLHTSLDGGDYLSDHVSPERFARDEKGNLKMEGKKLVTIDHSKDPLWKAMDNVRKTWKETGYDKRLKSSLDKLVEEGRMSRGTGSGTSFGKTGYWTSNREMFARTFERYVQRKMSTKAMKNTYLSGYNVKTDSYGLWPTDDETDKMLPAFDALFEAFKARKPHD